MAMNVMTTCVLDISTIFFITQHSRVQKYKSFPIRQILRKKKTPIPSTPIPPLSTLSFSITVSDSANFSCIVAIFVVLLFLLVYFALALLVFVVLVSLVFAAEKIQKQFNVKSFSLAFAMLDIESCLSEHLSTSHPVSIILNPKPLFCVPLRRCFFTKYRK